MQNNPIDPVTNLPESTGQENSVDNSNDGFISGVRRMSYRSIERSGPLPAPEDFE